MKKCYKLPNSFFVGDMLISSKNGYFETSDKKIQKIVEDYIEKNTKKDDKKADKPVDEKVDKKDKKDKKEDKKNYDKTDVVNIMKDLEGL